MAAADTLQTAHVSAHRIARWLVVELGSLAARWVGPRCEDTRCKRPANDYRDPMSEACIEMPLCVCLIGEEGKHIREKQEVDATHRPGLVGSKASGGCASGSTLRGFRIISHCKQSAYVLTIPLALDLRVLAVLVDVDASTKSFDAPARTKPLQRTEPTALERCKVVPSSRNAVVA